MHPDFLIHTAYPDGLNSPPVCSSNAVLSAFNMSVVASDYMSRPTQWRRQGVARGRNWDSPEPPIHLYKYRQFDSANPESIDRARQFLVNGRIWVADPSSLNDLHDMRFKLKLNPDLKIRKQWVKRNIHLLPKMPPAQRMQEERRLTRASLSKDMDTALTAEIEKSMGVFCASQDPRNEPMWAHYAADHCGICVQLDTTEDELFLLLRKVQYSLQFPTLSLPHSEEYKTEHFFFKSAEWAYEREWRVVVMRNRFSIELRPSAIKGVILGSRSNRATRNEIERLNAERVESGKPAFKIYQAKQHKNRYGVCIKQVCV